MKKNVLGIVAGVALVVVIVGGYMASTKDAPVVDKDAVTDTTSVDSLKAVDTTKTDTAKAVDTTKVVDSAKVVDTAVATTEKGDSTNAK